MTHAELQDIATDHCLDVVIFPDLEPALTGYIWDQALNGSDTIRAVYDRYKVLDCLVQRGMTDEEANEWFYTKRTTDPFAAANRKKSLFCRALNQPRLNTRESE